MKYTHNYAMRMPTREKITKPWNNFHGKYGLIFHSTLSGITSVEYGQIVHVTCIGKYYCKNMRYRINIYSIPHILTIVFPDTRNVEYLPIFHGVT